MNKKKLLITLGCSFTEGMGCYDMEVLPEGAHIYSWDLMSQAEIDYQRNRFHELGWPVSLGKKLGYDKVINLGFGGGSTSGNMKQFMEHYWDENFDEYEVLVLWWLPSAHRMSFYSEDIIHHVIPPGPDEDPREDDPYYRLGREYVRFIENFPEDTYLEQIFYLKLMINHCRYKGFKFIWYADNHHIDQKHFDEYPAKENWIGVDSESMNQYVYENPNWVSPVCNHPNEFGYEEIAKIFYKHIKERFPTYTESDPVDSIEQIWKGNPELNFNKDEK
jgi:hypothetical protein